jgi:hypothetical protein
MVLERISSIAFARTHLVGRGFEFVTRDLRDGFRDLDIKASLGVQTLREHSRLSLRSSKAEKRTYSSDGSSTLSQHAQSRDDGLNSRNAVGELLNVAGELLTQGQRSGILQVGSTDLDNVLERLSLGLHGIVEFVQGGKKRGVDLGHSGDVHGGGETDPNVSIRFAKGTNRRNSRIVGTLRHVHVVVRVNWLLAAQFTTQNLDGSVGDNLVNVHVGLSTGSGLENDQGEVVDELSGDDVVGAFADGFDDLGVEACSNLT